MEAFIKIAESEGVCGQVINIGTNSEISVEELVRKISVLLGKELKISCDSQRVRPKTSEVLRLKADNTKAKQLLKWQPAVSLDEGLKKTIDYISKNISRYKIKEYNI